MEAVAFTRTYNETLEMIVEARNYMAFVESRERQRRDVATNLRHCCEALRVTSRLTEAMAWLMMQRAVQQGEVTMQEALGERHRLSGQSICLEDAANHDETLPIGLRSLLDRSLRLYQRVGRLEQMVMSRAMMN
jgi:regulator of CtrA degradation